MRIGAGSASRPSRILVRSIAKRMETIDDETAAAAIDYMGRQVKADKPFFVWMNATRMHVFTHVRASMRGQSGMPGNEYADGMIEHDGDVGKLLKSLDELGIAGNTIVVYTTDNGPNQFSWPDAATTPFRSEKDTNWEGAFRVPAMVRWPGKIKTGEISNEMFSGLDWFPTLLAAAGDATIKDRLLNGANLGGVTFRVHLDGYDQLDFLTGRAKTGARTDFTYFDDDGDLVGYRHQDWKAVFEEQKHPGGFAVWYEPLTAYRIPKVFNLRMDLYERADIVSDQYDDWRVRNAYLMGWLNLKAVAFLETFKDYPPSQIPASFTIDQVQKNIDDTIQALKKAPTPLATAKRALLMRVDFGRRLLLATAVLVAAGAVSAMIAGAIADEGGVPFWLSANSAVLRQLRKPSAGRLRS